MEVLLKADIDKLGQRGEIVNVADGYARNYLIPQHLASPATAQAKREFQAQEQATVRHREAQLQQLAGLAQTLEVASCTIVAQANPEGHLFGSVTPEMVADAFAEDGIKLRPSMILLDEPIKESGVFPIQVRLTPELVCSTRVWVVEA